MISKYKTMRILLANVHLDCRGRVRVTGMLAGMNLSKLGMNLSKPGMNLLKPGENHNNHVIILYIHIAIGLSLHVSIVAQLFLHLVT